MNGTKGILQSKTIWSGILLLTAFVLSQFGYALTDEDQFTLLDQVLQGVTAISAFVGSIGVIYGRIVASKQVKPGGGAALALLMLVSLILAGGCSMSPTQRAAAITRTYTATVEATTAAADAGLLTIEDAEQFEAARAEASTELDAMWDAILAGQTITAQHIIKRAESVVDRLYQAQLKREKNHDTLRGDGADARPATRGAGDRPTDPGFAGHQRYLAGTDRIDLEGQGRGGRALAGSARAAEGEPRRGPGIAHRNAPGTHLTRIA